MIRPASERDLAEIVALLSEAALPTDGVSEHLATFLVAEHHGRIVGAAGLELYGETALLRSVVVARNVRSSGIGSALYDAITTFAKEVHVKQFILLTTTADQYFERKGFVKIDRSTLTGPITQSVEFASACPASAVCMKKDVDMRVLILCTGNSCRSQMAEGLLKKLKPEWEVFSAGTLPASAVSRRTIRVMQEIGIDISQNIPKSVDPFLTQSFDYVLTVCDHANETCPVFTGNVKNRIHIGFPDPTKIDGKPDEVFQHFRRVRDDMSEKLKLFFETL